MLKFEFDKEPDCMRCHHCVSSTCYGSRHIVDCDVRKERIGHARVPTYCPKYSYLHGDTKKEGL